MDMYQEIVEYLDNKSQDCLIKKKLVDLYFQKNLIST